MRSGKFWFAWMVIAALFAGGAPGCGASRMPAVRRAVVPVHGRLLFQGRPAAGALVVLHPLADRVEAREWSAGFPRGRVAEDGSFRLTTYQLDDGAPTGRYVIVVSWTKSTSSDEHDGERGGARLSSGGGEEDRLAGRYADPRVSRLSCVVEGPRADLGRIDLQ